MFSPFAAAVAATDELLQQLCCKPLPAPDNDDSQSPPRRLLPPKRSTPPPLGESDIDESDREPTNGQYCIYCDRPFKKLTYKSWFWDWT